MKNYEFINKNIGNKVCIIGDGDLAMNGEFRQLIFKGTELTIVKLTKGGLAYLMDDNGKYYSVPPKNVRLATGYNKITEINDDNYESSINQMEAMGDEITDGKNDNIFIKEFEALGDLIEAFEKIRYPIMEMKTAEGLLKLLGVKNYTERHLRIINDFITNNETDCKKLLTDLGGWDASDLEIAERWLNESK